MPNTEHIALRMAAAEAGADPTPELWDELTRAERARWRRMARVAKRAGLALPGPVRPRRRRPPIETTDYGAMARRMLRAYGRRVAEGDPEDLAELLALQSVLDQTIAAAVDGMREGGASWADIARATGATRQAAAKRWGTTERTTA